MKENWLALYLCIFTDASITDAVYYMKTGRRNRRFNKAVGIEEEKATKKIKVVDFSECKCRRVLELRKDNRTWNDIAKIYGMNVNTLKTKVFKYKKRAIADEPTKVPYAICSDKKSFIL